MTDRQSSISELRLLITALLSGDLEFSDFEREYVNCFTDRNADEHFTDADHDLYGDLFERLQWTGKHLTGLDRATGYHTRAETEDFIRRRLPELS